MRLESSPVDAPEGQRTTSLSENPVTDSENAKVMVSVWPAFMTPVAARVMLTDGTTPSTLCAA